MVLIQKIDIELHVFCSWRTCAGRELILQDKHTNFATPRMSSIMETLKCYNAAVLAEMNTSANESLLATAAPGPLAVHLLITHRQI